MSSSAVRVETWLKNAAVRAEALTDVKIWGLALVTGVATGYGVLAFSIAIEWVTEWAYGAPTAMLVDGARELSRWRTFLVPVLGALVVAAALAFSRRAGWVTDIRMQGVAEVIEARAKPPGAISFRSGLMNTGMAAVALGTGSSAGREGPAVLLGGAISVYLAKTFKLSAKDSRTLLGCAAAAAVSAAFNAPIAGVLFALEVVLSNYALSIFSPIALSSIAATLISRAHLGD
ncbi:MAG: chloride channel protein, partial [Pseudomonadota bacterium]